MLGIRNTRRTAQQYYQWNKNPNSRISHCTNYTNKTRGNSSTNLLDLPGPFISRLSPPSFPALAPIKELKDTDLKVRVLFFGLLLILRLLGLVSVLPLLHVETSARRGAQLGLEQSDPGIDRHHQKKKMQKKRNKGKSNRILEKLGRTRAALVILILLVEIIL